MNVTRAIFILLIFACTIGFSYGQKKIKWMTWEEAIEKSKVEKKKILVDIYTEWCGWCKKMDKSTMREEFIVEYVNNNFYAVKFDAEFKEDISINDEIYSYEKYGKKGYHRLAKTLTKGKLSFPTIVFLDESFEVLQAVPGFQDSQRFEKIISFFAGDHFKSTPWKRYERSYTRNTYALPAGN